MAASQPDTFESLGARYGPAYRWLVVITCLTAMMGMVLSSVSMNVAIPSVMGTFGVGQDQAQWVATGYLATMVTGMLLNSWLVAALGQRLTFIIVISIFLGASVIGAFATTIEMLIVSRVIQGIAAGVTQPFSMMVIFQVFPPERRGTAMGMFGMGVVLAPVFGPLLGGLAIDMLGWRYIFAMPVPLIAIAAILGPIFLPERAEKGAFPPFDWTGLILLIASLALVLTALTSGQRLGWLSDEIVGRGVLGLCFTVAFVWWEGKAKRPLLDFTLFENPRFACAMGVSFIFGICLFGSSYILPVFTQIVQGYTATRAGWLLALGGSVMIVMFPVSGRLADSMPPNLLISTGLLIFGTGFFFIHDVDVNTSFWLLAFLSAYTRIGLSAVITPLNATSLRYVPPEKLANASSNANFFRQLGGGMGIAILVAVLDTRILFHATALTATQTPANPISMETMARITEILGVTGIPEATRQALASAQLGQIIYAKASIFGFQDVFLVLAFITFSALIPAWFLRKPVTMVPAQVKMPKADREPEEVPEPKPAVPSFASPAHRLLHRRYSQRTPAAESVDPPGRRIFR